MKQSVKEKFKLTDEEFKHYEETGNIPQSKRKLAIPDTKVKYIVK